MKGAAGRIVGKTSLVLCGLVAGVLLLEVFIRLVGPAMLEYDGGAEHLYFDRPELLPEEYRAAHPCLGRPPPPRAGGDRVLFLGDSVTRRARIIDALRRHHRGRKLQWLNAGIAGYNTQQEVGLYRRCCRWLRAGHVVLTMHNNDFQQNRLIFQRPFSARQVQLDLDRLGPVERLLTYNSHVYRLILGRPGIVGEDPVGQGQWWRARARMEQDLRQLRQMVSADGARLSVVLLPSLKTGRLPRPARTSHRSALQILRRLGIRHFDLQQVFFQAQADGVVLHESPGDFRHPSQELADRFGAHLHRIGLLEKKLPEQKKK